MKTMIQRFIGLSLITVLLTMTVSATDSLLNVKVKKEAEKKISLYVNQMKSDELKVDIKDQKNMSLYSDVFKGKNYFIQKFDLIQLPSGVYTFEIENSKRLVSYDLTISESSLSIGQHKEILKPTFVQIDQMVKLKVGVNNVTEGSISVFNMDSEKLYEEMINKNGIVQKAFDFSEVDNKIYIIRTSIDGRQFEFQVN